MLLDKKVIVASSKIHGRGLFATTKFTRGEKIIEYTGERLTMREYATRYGKNKLGIYVLAIPEVTRGDTTIFIDAVDEKKSNEARFSNDAHGTEFTNNAYFAVQCVENKRIRKGYKRKMYIIAGKDIEVGEEILTDYGDVYWRVPSNS